MSSSDKPVRHRAEYAAYRLANLILKATPAKHRVNGIAWILGKVGPKISAHKRLISHLTLVYPDMDDKVRQDIAQQAWRNLGIVYSETMEGAKLTTPMTREGEELKAGIIRTQNFHHYEACSKGKPGTILIGAHFGNWELSTLFAGQVCDNFMGFYREQNNPWLNQEINKIRTSTGATLIAKNNRQGLRQVITSLKSGGSVGFLMDQRIDTGPTVPFLGIEAQTMPLAYTLAHATGAAVIPYRLKREQDQRYTCIFETPCKVPDTGNRQADRTAFLTQLNQIMSGWIDQDPEQWFWFHRRWGRT